ncbi:MAG: NYN domain-containing protein [Hyphomicrobium sp.]|nr:NYN domain-containing protein [Hyphomicrobium sp.]
MKGQTTGPLLSAVFIDYDNIYLSLKRKNEDAAKRFAKDAGLWLREIESGRLITPTNSGAITAPRRIVLNRCYGNPVPRRNASDNSTDMNSFPFVRHHFLRAGMEAVDCPPLTSQLKNSADIRMVMDVRDLLGHDTYYDEFVILSGDADFTPLLHRLRAHARRTVVFANDHTAAPYTAIADGEIREAQLINLLVENRGASAEPVETPDAAARQSQSVDLEATRGAILAEVVAWVRGAGQPVPLEALADRAVRTLGHDRTVGTAWGGAGSFSALLAKGLPPEVRLSEQPPYYLYDTTRQLVEEQRIGRPDAATRAAQTPRTEPAKPEPARAEPQLSNMQPRQSRIVGAAADPFGQLPIGQGALAQPPVVQTSHGQTSTSQPMRAELPLAASLSAPPAPIASSAALGAAPASAVAPSRPPVREPQSSIQQSITRIHEACQAPPLAPPEYRVLFDVMAQEITANGLMGAQTLSNIAARAAELGVEARRDDIRFVLEVVSEVDPWFEQGASSNLFSSRFRNFVIARCRGQGLQLSSEELDLIDAWFGGSPAAQRAPLAQATQRTMPQQAAPARAEAPLDAAGPTRAAAPQMAGDRWWGADEGRDLAAAKRGLPSEDEMPLIVRNRLRI